MQKRYKTNRETREKYPIRCLGTEVVGTAAKDAENGRPVNWDNLVWWANLTSGLPLEAIKHQVQSNGSTTDPNAQQNGSSTRYGGESRRDPKLSSLR